MKKRKNNQRSKNSITMLGQKTGSMLDLKTNEDFNNQHPDHDDTSLINNDSEGLEIKSTNKIRPKKIEVKSKFGCLRYNLIQAERMTSGMTAQRFISARLK